MATQTENVVTVVEDDPMVRIPQIVDDGVAQAQAEIEAAARLQPEVRIEPEATERRKPAPPEGGGDSVPMARYKALEQQFRVIKGKLDTEGPLAAREKAALEARIRDMERRMEEVVTQRQTAKEDPLEFLKPEEREAVATDGESIDARIAKGHAKVVESRLLSRLEKLERDLQASRDEARNASQRSDADKFFDEVEAVEAGAKELMLGSDPVFDSWLDGRDPKSRTGRTYRDRKDALRDLGDAEGLAALAREFGAAYDGRGSEAIRDQVQPRGVRVKSGKPAKAGGTVPEITESFVREFTDRSNKGTLRHDETGLPWTEAEIDQTETMIGLAIRAGKIIPG